MNKNELNINNDEAIFFKLVHQNFNASEPVLSRPINKPKEFFKSIIKSKSCVVGLTALFLLIFGVITFPLIWRNAGFCQPSIKNLSMFSRSNTQLHPNRFHFFGTDSQGRDIWSSLWSAMAYSLLLAFCVVAINTIVGITLGLLTGYFNWFDKIMQLIIKVISCVPSILVLIILTSIFRTTFWTIILGLTVVGWDLMCLQVRAEVIKNRQLDYFVASEILGTPFYKKLLNFLPVASPVIITRIVISFPFTILAEASLGFIGLSIQNQLSLGSVIYTAKINIFTNPQQIVIPVMALIVITVSVQLIGEGLQKILKGGE